MFFEIYIKNFNLIKKMKRISVNNTFQNTSTATRTIKEVITIESDSSDSTEDASYENQNQFTDNFNVFRMNLFTLFF